MTASPATATIQKTAAHCPICGYKAKPTRNGLIPSHRARRVGVHGTYMAENCEGIGYEPWYPEGEL